MERRGGRGSEALAAQEAEARATAAREMREHLNDLRTMCRHPEFIRIAQTWIDRSGYAKVCLSLNGAEVIAHEAKRSLGVTMWNEIMKADPIQAVAFVVAALPPETPEVVDA